MKPTKKPTTPRAARKTPAKRARTGGSGITPAEIRPLVLEAKRAFDFQRDLGNIDAKETFDDWRRAQVMACCNCGGLSKISRGQWRQVMAHFAMLAGRDNRALDLLLKSGRVKDHGPADDTHEAREEMASLIRDELEAHAERPDLSGKGHIRAEYALSVARAKSGTQVRALDELAARLTARQLRELLYTIRQRIAGREGRADPEKRQAGYRRRAAAKKAREAAADTPQGTVSRPLPDDPF